MLSLRETQQVLEDAILSGIDVKSIPEKTMVHILRNLHNTEYLNDILKRLEKTCSASGQSQKVGTRKNRYKSKYPSGKWTKQKGINKGEWKSQQKKALDDLKREEANRDAIRLAKKTIGIKGNEKNIGDILEKELKGLITHKPNIKILKGDFKSLTYEGQINYIDSYNAIILDINSIDDLLNDLFDKDNELTFNEEQESLFKTVDKLNKLFVDTPFEGAFAKTIEFVRESWKDWSVRYYNLGLFSFPYLTWKAITLTIVDDSVLIKAVDELGPHIKQYEHEAAEATIREGLSKRERYERYKAKQARLKKIHDTHFNPPKYIDQVEGWLETKQVIEEGKGRQASTPPNKRTRMKKATDLKSGRLIDEFDYGTSIVPSVIEEGNGKQSSTPPNMRTRMKNATDLKYGRLIGEFDRGAFIVPSVIEEGKGRQASTPPNMRTRMKNATDLNSGRLIGEFDYGASIVPSVVNKGNGRQGGTPPKSVFPPPLFRPTTSLILRIGHYKVNNPNYDLNKHRIAFNTSILEYNPTLDKCVTTAQMLIIILRFFSKLMKSRKVSRKMPKSKRQKSPTPSPKAKTPSPKAKTPSPKAKTPSPHPYSFDFQEGDPNYKSPPPSPVPMYNSNNNKSRSSHSPSPVQMYKSSSNNSLPWPPSPPPVRRTQSAPSRAKSKSSHSNSPLANNVNSQSKPQINKSKTQKKSKQSDESKNTAEFNKLLKQFQGEINRTVCAVDLERDRLGEDLKDIDKQLKSLAGAPDSAQKTQDTELLRSQIDDVHTSDSELLAIIKRLEGLHSSLNQSSSVDILKEKRQAFRTNREFKPYLNDSQCIKKKN